MCTYVTNTAALDGSAIDRAGAFRVRNAVVIFDHPQDAPFEHALCIDFRSGTDPAQRMAVELDHTSARRLAESILATLDSEEVQDLV